MVFGELISKVKGMFAKEPEIFEEVEFGNIDEWFSNKLSSSKGLLKGKLDAIKEKIASESSAARENMQILKNAELRNPNIPEKAKHFMEGNRAIYIQKTGQFIESIAVPEEAGNVESFIAGFVEKLEDFGKSTARPFAILREFFEEEASKVAGNIKGIDNCIAEIREALKESRLRELYETRHLISRVKDRTSHKEILVSSREKKNSYLEELKKQKETLEKGISEMEESKGYADYRMFRQKLGETRKLVKEKESELSGIFASLERPMKKYLRVMYNDRDLLEKYIKSPVDGLMQDFGLKIISILGNMKKAIVDNTIELKDRQRVKAIEDIHRIDKDMLSSFLSSYAKVKKKEGDIAAEMERIDVIEKLAKAKEKLKIASAMIGKAEEDIEKIDSELSKIDIELMKKELEEKASKAVGTKISIS